MQRPRVESETYVRVGRLPLKSAPRPVPGGQPHLAYVKAAARAPAPNPFELNNVGLCPLDTFRACLLTTSVATNYPLVFTFKDIIVGNGFFAGVVAEGRALLTHEDDGGFWMSGVYPGAVAGGGEERGEAFRDFKDRYKSVLLDIAAEAPDFNSFVEQAASFFNSLSKPTAEEWEAARSEVRAGRITAADLPQVDAAEPRLSVCLLEPQPSANSLDDFIIAEAA